MFETIAKSWKHANHSEQHAAAETAAITRGSLDYIVANAAYVPGLKTFEGIGTLYVGVASFSVVMPTCCC